MAKGLGQGNLLFPCCKVAVEDKEKKQRPATSESSAFVSRLTARAAVQPNFAWPRQAMTTTAAPQSSFACALVLRLQSTRVAVYDSSVQRTLSFPSSHTQLAPCSFVCSRLLCCTWPKYSSHHMLLVPDDPSLSTSQSCRLRSAPQTSSSPPGLLRLGPHCASPTAFVRSVTVSMFAVIRLCSTNTFDTLNCSSAWPRIQCLLAKSDEIMKSGLIGNSTESRNLRVLDVKQYILTHTILGMFWLRGLMVKVCEHF